MTAHRLPTPDQPSYPVCCVCFKPLDETAYENAHWVHEEGCPRFFDRTQEQTCECDLWAHANHCPVCEPEAARLAGEIAETEQANGGAELLDDDPWPFDHEPESGEQDDEYNDW